MTIYGGVGTYHVGTIDVVLEHVATCSRQVKVVDDASAGRYYGEHIKYPHHFTIASWSRQVKVVDDVIRFILNLG